MANIGLDMRYCIYVFASFLLFFSSCQRVIMSAYGIKKNKKLTAADIIKYSEMLDIDTNSSFVIDTLFRNYIAVIDSPLIKKNHFQPLQVIYFEVKSGKPVSFHVNCYAGGFPNLNWNGYGSFNQFIPTSVAPVDSSFTLTKQLTYLSPLFNSNFKQKTMEYSYVAVIYWNRFMYRQSKRLIKLVRENAITSPDSVLLLFANNDNLYADD